MKAYGGDNCQSPADLIRAGVSCAPHKTQINDYGTITNLYAIDLVVSSVGDREIAETSFGLSSETTNC